VIVGMDRGLGREVLCILHSPVLRIVHLYAAPFKLSMLPMFVSSGCYYHFPVLILLNCIRSILNMLYVV
jgi:hypothetical protein